MEPTPCKARYTATPYPTISWDFGAIRAADIVEEVKSQAYPCKVQKTDEMQSNLWAVYSTILYELDSQAIACQATWNPASCVPCAHHCSEDHHLISPTAVPDFVELLDSFGPLDKTRKVLWDSCNVEGVGRRNCHKMLKPSITPQTLHRRKCLTKSESVT